jgi:hypothetical protein
LKKERKLNQTASFDVAFVSRLIRLLGALQEPLNPSLIEEGKFFFFGIDASSVLDLFVWGLSCQPCESRFRVVDLQLHSRHDGVAVLQGHVVRRQRPP